jgi:hypothetical protein
MWSCTKQPYYEIPTDENGNVVITGVAETTSDGITTLDDNFTVSSYLPNAKEGDVMKVELLQLQPPPGGGSAQLLPMAGTQKEVTLGSNLEATVNYTRNEARLVNVGDYVTVTFSGKTDAATFRVDLKEATAVSNPQYNGTDVDIIRGAGTANFTVTVTPASGAYSGDVLVKRKNGTDEPWQTMGTYSPGDAVPVSGDDFAAGKDTMFYSFLTNRSGYTDEIVKQVVAGNPYFFIKKPGTLTVASGEDGFNLLNGTVMAANNAGAVITLESGPLSVKEGGTWATGGKNISFVASTANTYNLNSVTDAQNEFLAGTPVSSIDPSAGTGIYVFKLVNGGLPADVLYGMIKLTKVVPDNAIEFEYRIGNIYDHYSVVE